MPLQYRYCPLCGHPLERRCVEHERQERLVCSSCGFIMYQNSKPCAGALVTREGRLLLARRGVEPARGAWDIPGGFLENGEHPRDGAIRELREETGLEILPTELLGIYMDGYGDGEQAILNVYYLADIVSGSVAPADDVDALQWFRPDEIPQVMAFNHEYAVLEDWKRRMIAQPPFRSR